MSGQGCVSHETMEAVRVGLMVLSEAAWQLRLGLACVIIAIFG